MSFIWKHYHELADFLVTSPVKPELSDACLRSAVSRYYYAAFHHAMAYCRGKLGFKSDERASDHAAVRRALRIHSHAAMQHLEKLCDWREACDYRDTYSGDLKKLAIEAKYSADAVVRLLRV